MSEDREKQELAKQMADELANEMFSPEQNYPPERYMNFLDKKGGAKFDREVASQIFDRLPKNKAGLVSPGTFCGVYIDAFSTLKRKIVEIEKEIGGLRSEVTHAQEKIAEAKRRDVVKGEDKYCLTVKIYSGHNLTAGPSSSPLVVILASGQTRSIKPLVNGNNPVYNQTAELHISLSTSYFTVTLTEESGEALGATEVTLVDLLHSEQGKKQTKLTFKDSSGNVLTGYVTATVQLVKSFAQQELQSNTLNESRLNDLNEQRDLWLRFLTALSLPFPFLVQKKDALYQEVQQIRSTLKTSSAHGQPKLNDASLTSNGAAEPKEPTSTWEVWSKNWQSFTEFKLATVVLLVYTCLVLMTSFERHMFLDQFLGLSLVVRVFVDLTVNLLYAGQIILGLAFQTVVDAVWLWHYWSHWWDAQYVDGSSLRSLRFLTLLSTLLLLLTRLGLCFLVFRLARLRLHSPPEDFAGEHLNRYGDNGLAVYREPSFSDSSVVHPPGLNSSAQRRSLDPFDSVYLQAN